MSTSASRDELHDDVAHRLGRTEQRYTRARRAIVDVLASQARPLSVPELVTAARLPQSSVYRNLAELERVGAVVRLPTGDEFARYELAEHLAGHHHHLLCTACGRVFDFTLPPAAERAMVKAAGEIVEGQGFTALGHRVELFGHCRDCT
jgi:Fur family transcriptional regulator, ferric uptake regulator